MSIEDYEVKIISLYLKRKYIYILQCLNVVVLFRFTFKIRKNN